MGTLPLKITVATQHQGKSTRDGPPTANAKKISLLLRKREAKELAQLLRVNAQAVSEADGSSHEMQVRNARARARAAPAR